MYCFLFFYIGFFWGMNLIGVYQYFLTQTFFNNAFADSGNHFDDDTLR